MSHSLRSELETDHSADSPYFATQFRDDQVNQRHDTPAITTGDTSNMSENSGVDISTSQRMISATWGSIITSLLVTPLDVVRVRLQSQSAPAPVPLNLSKFPAYATNFEKLPPDLGVKACCKEVFWIGDNAEFCIAGNGHTTGAAAGDCAVEETQRRTFNSTLDGLKKIARNEGVRTLWRGLSPTLVMTIPANVIYFTGYDWLRHHHNSPVKIYAGDTYSPLVAGSVARVAAAVVVSPIEMFRTRMQATSTATTSVFRETLSGLHRMTKTQGYASLWRGLTLTMWRDVPFSGIYWFGYEAVRTSLTDSRQKARRGELSSDRSLTRRRQDQDSESHYATFVDSFTAGATSGAFAAFVTTPFDVGKTRQQVYRHAGDEAASVLVAKKEAAISAGKVVPEELSMPRFLYHIYMEEGTSGLFKGWAARCLKVAPACAIMISSYELGKRWAKGANAEKGESGNAI